MKVINLQFDSMEFIPVVNSKGEYFVYKLLEFPNNLHSSPPNTTFKCYTFGEDGKLLDKTYFFQKEELSAVSVTVINSQNLR